MSTLLIHDDDDDGECNRPKTLSKPQNPFKNISTYYEFLLHCALAPQTLEILRGGEFQARFREATSVDANEEFHLIPATHTNGTGPTRCHVMWRDGETVNP